VGPVFYADWIWFAGSRHSQTGSPERPTTAQYVPVCAVSGHRVTPDQLVCASMRGWIIPGVRCSK
jgi:hypothetical protein